jgi:hypothetical protein
MKGERPGAVTIMTAMPPEPDLSPQGSRPALQGSHAAPTQPLAVPPPSAFPPPPDPSPQDLAGPPRPRRMGPLRIITGVMWAVIAVLCAAGAVGEWLIGLHAAAVLCLVIAVGSGWYDYRVWTFRARRFLL